MNLTPALTERLVTLGRLTALISFVVGTLLFLGYFLTASSTLLFVGYGYIALAGLVNGIVLILLWLKADKDRMNRKKLLATCKVMLLNIPVALLYCWGTLALLGVMRITFLNATSSTLRDVAIVGCGGGHLNEIRAGESKTVWVPITDDCSISIAYTLADQRKQETVAGYVTGGMGQKLKHTIGGQNAETF